ncbi:MULTISPECIES: sigma-70 family RNA polymerase sigma factor [unclassified Leifsonia]|uniref:RNA polymerase sigma factor n=1 Tax=unclassified Leifsonia TaxID=2663824 RepID=UPI0008A7B7F9|nr:MULTISPECIES: sigma-70 family RNA polymerase sigma factor [unclassified Leifsonia]SEH56912.1 RNA polymerase sigma factor, sigma-70 family [Leifsonia sp. CL154]SFL21933.1 RNA polymerase sigma factor, sigma-70 family [Leifsonia sp. CL147]
MDDTFRDADAELISRVRQGQTSAYAELWIRHRPLALSVARHTDPHGDPEDPVSEAFTSVYVVLRAGGGPTTAFRPYLATAVHRSAIRHARARASLSLAVTLDEHSLDDPDALPSLDRLAVRETLAKLPPQYRQILVLMLVHGYDVRAAASQLGISYNATTILAMRARNRFRTLWHGDQLPFTRP